MVVVVVDVLVIVGSELGSELRSERTGDGSVGQASSHPLECRVTRRGGRRPQWMMRASAARVDRAPPAPELSRVVQEQPAVLGAERDALLAVGAHIQNGRLVAVGELADDGGHGGANPTRRCGRP